MGFLESSPIGPETVVCCVNEGCQASFKKKDAIMIVDTKKETISYFCSKACRRNYTDTGQDQFEGE